MTVLRPLLFGYSPSNFHSLGEGNQFYVHINMCLAFSPRWETIWLSFLQWSCLWIRQLITEGHYRLSDVWCIQHPGLWGCDTTTEWKHQLSVPGIEPWISRLKDRPAIHSATAPRHGWVDAHGAIIINTETMFVLYTWYSYHRLELEKATNSLYN